MNTTIPALLSLACPAFTAVCLYRSNHRKHRRPTTVVAWSLALPAVIGPLLAAQHTQGWGVVGWLLQLLTCAVCIIHLAGWKLHRKKRYPKRQAKAKAKAKWQDNLSRGRSAPGAPGSRASHPIFQWGRDFLGIHRPWTPKQRPQALTEHREEILSAMADEARALGRVDVLEDAMAEVYQTYGAK